MQTWRSILSSRALHPRKPRPAARAASTGAIRPPAAGEGRVHAAGRRWDRAEAELRAVEAKLRAVEAKRLDAHDRARYHVLRGYVLVAAGREATGYAEMGAGAASEIGAGERVPADPAFDWGGSNIPPG